jgi:dTDP-4-dehydrorhamnose reductase
MRKPIILVTGAEGQLGKSLQQVAPGYSGYDFVFVSRTDMPLDKRGKLEEVFQSVKPQFCINCAAYTAVDKAEAEANEAFLINAEAVGVLAQLCKAYSTKFIHVSTDYVFNGMSAVAYKENDALNPVNVYGASKAKGEGLALAYNAGSVIIRTAWVYSEYGKNFVKTMIQLMEQRNEINVVNDQVGSPTYAVDLAQAIMRIIQSDQWVPGIFHFCNKGEISWYDFAVAIKSSIQSHCVIHPIPASAYPTPAKRPSFSLLDTTKITATYGVTIPHWKNSLETCINNYRSARN